MRFTRIASVLSALTIATGLAAAPALASPAHAAGCPKASVLVSEGTWATNTTTAPKKGSVLSPLLELRDKDTEVWYNPYPAQFKLPTKEREHDMEYDKSKAIGISKLKQKAKRLHDACPKTDQYWVGYSQGADVTATAAEDPGVPVKEVTAIADPGLTPGVGRQIGTLSPGVGALTLPVTDIYKDFVTSPFGQWVIAKDSELKALMATAKSSFDGVTFNGKRKKFGVTVNEICAPGDGFCDATNETTLSKLISSGGNSFDQYSKIHIGYNSTKYWTQEGRDAVTWTIDRIKYLKD